MARERPTVDVMDRRWLDSLPEGWLSEAEAILLAELARDRVVLEVGAWLGRSTVAMAHTAKLVLSVDHHRGSQEHQAIAKGTALYAAGLTDPVTGEHSTLRRFMANIAGHDNVVPIVAPLELVYGRLMNVDLAFIDAQHDHDSVVADAQHAADCLTAEGALAFHDFGTWSGVVSAVKQLQRTWKARLEAFPGTSIALLRL